MNIFLKNIPEGTRRDEIIRFIAPIIKGGMFRSEGEILSLKLLTLKGKEMEEGTAEHHAMLDVVPASAALRLIKKLDGKKFKGEPITVRQYFFRDSQNDRRSVPEGKAAAFIGMRKLPDRRRDLQVTALVYSTADYGPVVITTTS